jgi:type II secretory pathway pseudopilin PulG
MEKNYFKKALNCLFAAIIGAVIILLVMIGFLGYSFQKETKKAPEEEVAVESVNTVITLADSVNLLNAKVNDLSKELEECQEAAKKVVAVPKAKPVATPTPPTPQKVVVELVLKNSEPAAPTPVSTPRVEQPIVRSAAPAPAPAPQQGKVIACFRTNGSGDQHFPHYALDRGASVANAVDNGQKGYNYELSPVESVSGSLPGVTFSGVYFIPKAYLEKYLNMSGESLRYVDVICENAWGGVRMSLQGDYYVYNSR